MGTKPQSTLASRNRALKTLLRCNQVLFHAENEWELLEDVCRIIVETGAYKMVWVGYPDQDEYKSIKPVAHFGEEAGYLELLKLTWDDTDRGYGPTGTAVRTGKPCVVRDIRVDPYFIPWRAAAMERGYTAVASFPLHVYKKPPNAITMYATEANAFDEDELELLEHLSESLAYGIEEMRLGEIRKQAVKKLKEREEKYRLLADHIADIVWTRDMNMKLTYISPSIERISGFSVKEKMTQNFEQSMTPHSVTTLKKIIEEELTREQAGTTEPDRSITFHLDMYRKDGSIYPVEATVSFIRNDEGEATGIVGINRDITERKRAEEEVQKLSRALEASSSGVIITGLDGDIEYVNPRFTETTGYSKEEVLGKQPNFLKPGKTQKDTNDELWQTIGSGGEWKGELRNQKKDGSLFWERISASGVKNQEGQTTHYIFIQEDVTREYELTAQLSFQASHDSLTGLINRHEFERRTERLLSTIQLNKAEHAMCYLDLDQFKVVNDTCGHIAGDELLRQLASVLQGAVRHRDTLARLGGDEFGVLIEHCSLDHAHRVATSIKESIQDFQFSWEGQSFRVGASIGLVGITGSVSNLAELLQQADAACYMAKDLGRNRIHVYHHEDSELAQRQGEMQWVTHIQQALETDRFLLYAQVIVGLYDDRDKHYELLIRMSDNEGKIVPPGAFLPSAERYNLITQLDQWVVKNALFLLAGNPLFLEQTGFISINISGPSLADESFLNFVTKCLLDSGIDGEKICFEITETAAISNLNTAIKFISTLKGFGCRFALDDFGSGLSSFGYLKNLPVDYLKIDGMFVKDIVHDPIDRAMVKSINEIGQVMGTQTIAEFVENDIIKGILNEIGVNYAQGYGIDKPMPFDELLDRASNVTDINKPDHGKYDLSK